MTVHRYALVMGYANLGSACVTWSGKEWTVISTTRVLARTTVVTEEYVGTEGASVILGSVEICAKSASHVLIIATTGESAGMGYVTVSIITWGPPVHSTPSRT